MARAPSTTRLNVRLQMHQKHLIQEAAGLHGQTVSTFAVATLVREAEQVVERHEMRQISTRDRDVFLAALDQPPTPAARLQRAVNMHRAKVVS